MFLRHYGLREQPFGMTPDPRFLYLSASHREALASLVYGIETGRGFVGLIAEPGMGKTTVLFQLMERLRNSARTVFLFQTQGNTREFLCNVIADLGLDPGDQDVSSLQRQLNEILIQEARMGRQLVLIIDEAQNLDDAVLESVRMLSNFETPRSKLMQIVLSGQPALAEKLGRPELEQLRQRISIICRLTPFTGDETADYIRHRLETAGYQGQQLFTPEALSMIAERSEGIPRNVNNLCFHALSLAYAEGLKRVTGTVVTEVLMDLRLDSLQDALPSSDVTREAKNKHASKRTPGLEGVTLNRGRDDEGPVLLRGGKHYTPARRYVPRRRRESTHWAFWAVTLLTLLLGGEIFWAFLPAKAPRHAIKQFVDHTVGQAKDAAAKYDLLKKSSPAASSRLQTTVIHTGADAKSQPQNSDQSQSAVSVDPAPSQSDSSGSYSEKAAASANEVHSSHTDRPASPPEKSTGNAPGKSSPDDSRSSNQVAKGTIVIESNVGGSAITIDGQVNPNWQTPHIFTLPQGTYRVAVTQNGYSTWFKDVRVTPGHKHWITADLRRPRGVIVIDTDPPGMQVFIDGKAYGPSEVEASLSAGTHTYRVIPPAGRRPLEGSFVLKPGDVLTRKIRWLPSTSQPSASNKPDSEGMPKSSKSSTGREKS